MPEIETNPALGRSHAARTRQRGLLGELVRFVLHCSAVVVILIVVAIFARDWAIDYHQIMRGETPSVSKPSATK